MTTFTVPVPGVDPPFVPTGLKPDGTPWGSTPRYIPQYDFTKDGVTTVVGGTGTDWQLSQPIQRSCLNESMRISGINTAGLTIAPITVTVTANAGDTTIHITSGNNYNANYESATVEADFLYNQDVGDLLQAWIMQCNGGGDPSGSKDPVTGVVTRNTIQFPPGAWYRCEYGLVFGRNTTTRTTTNDHPNLPVWQPKYLDIDMNGGGWLYVDDSLYEAGASGGSADVQLVAGSNVAYVVPPKSFTQAWAGADVVSSYFPAGTKIGAVSLQRVTLSAKPRTTDGTHVGLKYSDGTKDSLYLNASTKRFTQTVTNGNAKPLIPQITAVTPAAGVNPATFTMSIPAIADGTNITTTVTTISGVTKTIVANFANNSKTATIVSGSLSATDVNSYVKATGYTGALTCQVIGGLFPTPVYVYNVTFTSGAPTSLTLSSAALAPGTVTLELTDDTGARKNVVVTLTANSTLATYVSGPLLQTDRGSVVTPDGTHIPNIAPTMLTDIFQPLTFRMTDANNNPVVATASTTSDHNTTLTLGSVPDYLPRRRFGVQALEIGGNAHDLTFKNGTIRGVKDDQSYDIPRVSWWGVQFLGCQDILFDNVTVEGHHGDLLYCSLTATRIYGTFIDSTHFQVDPASFTVIPEWQGYVLSNNAAYGANTPAYITAVNTTTNTLTLSKPSAASGSLFASVYCWNRRVTFRNGTIQRCGRQMLTVNATEDLWFHHNNVAQGPYAHHFFDCEPTWHPAPIIRLTIEDNTIAVANRCWNFQPYATSLGVTDWVFQRNTIVDGALTGVLNGAGIGKRLRIKDNTVYNSLQPFQKVPTGEEGMMTLKRWDDVIVTGNTAYANRFKAPLAVGASTCTNVTLTPNNWVGFWTPNSYAIGVHSGRRDALMDARFGATTTFRIGLLNVMPDITGNNYEEVSGDTYAPVSILYSDWKGSTGGSKDGPNPNHIWMFPTVEDPDVWGPIVGVGLWKLVSGNWVLTYWGPILDDQGSEITVTPQIGSKFKFTKDYLLKISTINNRVYY